MTEWETLALQMENDEWRDLATSIAITGLALLRQQGMTKQQLAEKMGVKPQYVSRVVKGHANLTLDTIAKLEKALGESIVSVSDPTDVVVATSVLIHPDIKWHGFYQAAVKGVFAANNKSRQPKAVYSASDDKYSLAS